MPPKPARSPAAAPARTSSTAKPARPSSAAPAKTPSPAIISEASGSTVMTAVAGQSSRPPRPKQPLQSNALLYTKSSKTSDSCINKVLTLSLDGKLTQEEKYKFTVCLNNIIRQNTNVRPLK